MAIYNAYCDRVPVYIIAGNILDATKRISAAEWVHSVQDAAAMVRDYLKWDDLPLSLPHFAESAVRAYKIAMTSPMMPVLLIADGELPSYPSQDVSDSELADLYAFLQSLAPAVKADPSSANARNGERLYMSYGCYECHGNEGQGSTQTGASRIGPIQIPFAPFVAYIRQPTAQMPPYSAKS